MELGQGLRARQQKQPGGGKGKVGQVIEKGLKKGKIWAQERHKQGSKLCGQETKQGRERQSYDRGRGVESP